jgi:hypothetical protein
MDTSYILLLVLTALTLINNGVQLYIHYQAYPLLAYVGKSDFAKYIEEYEKRLTIPLLLPYGLTLLSNLALIFIRPCEVDVIVVIVAFAFNLSVAIVTVRVATPVYEKVKASADATGSDMQQLMTINLVRLVLSTIASVIVLGMALTSMTTVCAWGGPLF